MRVNRLLAAALAVLLFTPAAVAAKEVSLEELKRMIDETAHLSEAPAASPALMPADQYGLAASAPSHTAVETLNAPASRRLLLDVRSNHSDGAHDMDMLARLAEKRGIDTLVFGEHDRYTIRLGLDPIARLVGVSQEHPSLYMTGLPAFFADLKRARNRHPGLHIMAATESTPGYHWSGTPFVDLTLHGAERHIIALGIERPEQVAALPSYDLRNIRGSLNISLAVWFALLLMLTGILLRCGKRRAALLLALSVVALLGIGLPEKRGDADADFIHAAKRQGLFTIWAHPGTLSGVRDGPLGVKLNTPPYNRRMFEEPTADAFAAVYGDSDSNTVPGGMWDRFMMDYMLGYRPHPIWAVAAGDYHAEGQANEYLGNYPMDVWAGGSDSKAVMAALRQGRNTSWGMPKDRNLQMSALFVEDGSGKRMLPGDEGEVGGMLTLYAGVSEWVAEGGEQEKLLKLRGEWIVDGSVAATATLPTDGAVSLTPLELEPGPHVVRLRIPVQHGVRMEANPFLLRVRK